MSVGGKYDELAERFTAHEYGDPERYFGHRAELVARLGPPLVPGELVLDLACADGSAAAPLAARGLRYLGVDASAAMVAAARTRGADAVEADAFAFRPAEPVAAVTIFRSLHLVPDRAELFRHVAGFAGKKLVFDLDPRRHSLVGVRAELAAAGFPRLDVRPFFVPQHARLPRPLGAALEALERTPLARYVLAVRFSVVCAASRGR